MKTTIFLLLFIACSVATHTQPQTGEPSGRGGSSRDGIRDSLLMSKEREKWDALRTGTSGALAGLYDDRFYSIGYLPDGSVELRTKAEITTEGEENFPPADFSIGDFKITEADSTTVLLTYRVIGPMNLLATSLWARRGNEWKTIFYQATKAE